MYTHIYTYIYKKIVTRYDFTNFVGNKNNNYKQACNILSAFFCLSNDGGGGISDFLINIIPVQLFLSISQLNRKPIQHDQHRSDRQTNLRLLFCVTLQADAWISFGHQPRFRTRRENPKIH